MSRHTFFRNIATAIWRDSGDPSVYGFVDLDVTDLKNKSAILAHILYALNHTILENPELTTMLKWGRIVQRKEKIMSVMVNIKGPKNDLSLLNIPVSDDLTIHDLKEHISHKSSLIRSYKDPHLGPVLRLIRFLPKVALKTFLKTYSFLIYELDTRLGLRFLPHRPFGSVIVSNVGSLGLKKALLPLVPLARASMMISVGKATPEVRYHEGEICVREIVHLGVTFDHRLFDGSHAAKMLADFEKSFAALKES